MEREERLGAERLLNYSFDIARAKVHPLATVHFRAGLGDATMPRKNALIAATLGENNILTFTVGDAGSFAVDVPALSEELRNRAMLHGIIQKIS